MTKLPKFFEYQKKYPSDKPLDFYPFEYDDKNDLFHIGQSSIATHDFDPYKFNPYALGKEEQSIEIEELADYPAVLPGFGSPIASPRTHDWVSKNNERLEEVVSTMHSVYASFFNNPEDIKLSESPGFMGFDAWSRQGGSIGLQVLGSCACMGPNLQGLYVRGMEHGFAEYDLHNADSQVQRVSLYAGLGYLALLASEEK